MYISLKRTEMSFFVDLICVIRNPSSHSSSVSPSIWIYDFIITLLNISLILDRFVGSISNFSAISFLDMVTQQSLFLVFIRDTEHRNSFVSSSVHFVEALAIKFEITTKASLNILSFNSYLSLRSINSPFVSCI